MVALPRISIGKKNKRSFFDLTHDVNTTSDFGFCQPTLVREFYKDCKIDLKTREFVRLGAMPCPTFGRIEVKTHTAFVPVKETFLAYDYLQAQKSVTSAFRSYVPQCADYVSSNTILGSIFELVCDVRNYYDKQQDWFQSDRFLGRFSVWTTWLGFCPEAHPLYSSHAPGDMVDIVNDDVIMNDKHLAYKACTALFNLVCGVPQSIDFENSPFYGKLKGSSYFNRTSLGLMNTRTGEEGEDYNKLWYFNFATYNPNRPAFPWDTVHPPYSGDGYGAEFMNSFGSLVALDVWSDDFLQAMSFDKPDFRLGHWTVPCTEPSGGTTSDVTLYVNFHFSRAGRRLYKVLTGCRISFGTKKKKIDLMRLLSYYKAWFDKYNPGRNLQWLDTNAFGIIHSYYDYGSVLDNVVNGVGSDWSRIPYNSRPRYRAFWYNFLADLPQCCYVLKPDNMTCATSSPLLEIDNNGPSLSSIKLYVDNDDSAKSTFIPVQSDEIYGNGNTLENGGLGIQLLNRIYHLVNKNSVIGSKIDEYLKAHNISRGLPQSNVLGDSEFMCNIDDVFATAGTSEANLGEYAGKGIGSGSSDNMHFECESFGYLVQLVAVVPLGGYVQGMRDCPISRYDFYQPEFDSLGMEPMSKSNFLNRRFNFDSFADDDSVFGFRPRYFGLKFENNLANGGFSLYSQQTQYLPYCLDRIFSVNDFSPYPSEDYVADEELRYIGRYERFGNYDRIFYDTKGLTDNFIIHMIQELKMYAPWKPISESYDTFDKDVDETSIDVEKA